MKLSAGKKKRVERMVEEGELGEGREGDENDDDDDEALSSSFSSALIQGGTMGRGFWGGDTTLIRAKIV